MEAKVIVENDLGHGWRYNKGVKAGYYEGEWNHHWYYKYLLPEAKKYEGVLFRASRRGANAIAEEQRYANANGLGSINNQLHSLEKRGEAGAGAHLFISWHTDANASDTLTGTGIWDDVNPRFSNKKLAELLARAIASGYGIPYRGVNYRYDTDGSNWYGVLYNAEAKHNLLLERAFHTNSGDCSKLMDDALNKRAARAFMDALASFYPQVKRKVETPRITTDAFIKRVEDGAILTWRTNQILPSISIAQGILESDSGNSSLAVEANNLFGIKATYPWDGESHEKITTEYVNGEEVITTASFRKYPSWNASIKDHAIFFVSTDWRKDLYKGVVGETDYKKAAEALQGTYATDPKYASKLVGVIERYGLHKFDAEVLSKIELRKIKYGVFAKNAADYPAALRIVVQIPSSALIAPGRTEYDAFEKVIQVGGARDAGVAVHLGGADRYETDEIVTVWIKENR